MTQSPLGALLDQLPNLVQRPGFTLPMDPSLDKSGFEISLPGLVIFSTQMLDSSPPRYGTGDGWPEVAQSTRTQQPGQDQAEAPGPLLSWLLGSVHEDFHNIGLQPPETSEECKLQTKRSLEPLFLRVHYLHEVLSMMAEVDWGMVGSTSLPSSSVCLSFLSLSAPTNPSSPDDVFSTSEAPPSQSVGSSSTPTTWLLERRIPRSAKNTARGEPMQKKFSTLNRGGSGVSVGTGSRVALER
ncbi:hypothetical protein INR49_031991 [Caranx melampygus]|nr:hypothetical protein INR49_031991 [Caranx melampygus]